MADFIINWIDLIWFPVAWYVALPRQRKWVLLYVFFCAITMRLQIELVHSTGFKNGFTNLLDSDVKLRATLIYGLFTAAFLVLVHYSPYSRWMVLLSAGITVYFFAFITSMLVMTV